MPKICPLTIRLPTASPIVGAPPAEVEGASCIGAQCAWYVPISDENGRQVDGSCAAALIPTGLAMLRQAFLEKPRAVTPPLASPFDT